MAMPKMNIRQLRDTKLLKAKLSAGQTVELFDRSRVIARIVPEGLPLPADKWPSFDSGRRQIFGDRVLPGSDLLFEERGRH